MTTKTKILKRANALNEAANEAFDFMEMMDAESLEEDWNTYRRSFDELIEAINNELK